MPIVLLLKNRKIRSIKIRFGSSPQDKTISPLPADDIFNTGYLKTVRPVNGRGGYFYVLKERGEIAANTVGNVPLKDGPVLFIVKTKQ
jgi:hypothetical protein